VSGAGRTVHAVVVSSAPPRRCGIALYARDLATALVAAEGRQVTISWVPVLDASLVASVGPVLTVLRGPDDTADSARAAAEAVNRAQPDVVWLQHEFGLFGRWQMPYRHMLGLFLEALRRPLVTTLHTVLSEPPSSVRRVVQRIGKLSARLVVMSTQAAHLLRDVYDIDPDKVSVIPHGVRLGSLATMGRPSRADAPMILSFGLISPGKGLDNVIRAMPAVLARWPAARYVIAGQSHPSLSWADSVGYRARLRTIANELGVAESIGFVDEFLTEVELDSFLARADLVVVPNLDSQQVSSGTLARAVGSSCAIVAGANGHSRDVAARGAVRLVTGTVPDETVAAITELLASPSELASLRQRAGAYAAATSWDVVARRSIRLLQALVRGG
jgi:glycosyltransferase involved in cell wall biosynthesis